MLAAASIAMIFSSLSQSHAAKFDIAAHDARLGELHRRDEPQEFLDRQIEYGGPILR